MSNSLGVESKLAVPHSQMMAWVVCLSAGLFFFYEFFQLNLFDVINEPLRDEFQMDAAQLSWMSSAYLWGDILFLLPAGIMLDRFSTRRVILVSMGVCVLATIGFALTYSYALATFFHAVTGVGNAFCFLCCVVLVSRWFPPRRQAMVIGCIVTMAFLGGMMAHTPLAYLYDCYGWRQALLIDGAFGAFIFLWIFFTVTDWPADHPHSIARHTLRPNFLQVLMNPQNWYAGLYTACLNLPIMVICALWGSNYLQVVHHLSQLAASNTVSMIFIGSILGCPLVGWLSDRSGHRKPLMIWGALATLLIVIPLFMWVPLSDYALAFLFLGLGFFSSTQVISYPLIAESNCISNTGAATGIASVIIMGGGAVGQILFGGLMQYHAGIATQNYTVADYQFAMWMFPIAAVASLVAIVLARETHCKRSD